MIEKNKYGRRDENMSKDILFKTDDFVFSYRVGGIIINNGKILLQKPKDDDYAIIGGHISSLETTADTLIREFKEELHADIEIERLMAVGEIFFPWGNKPCHQICLYYKVSLTEGNNIPMEGSFWGYDELDNQRVDLEYCWVPLEDLKKGLKVYPLELMPHVLEERNEIVHFISKEI